MPSRRIDASLSLAEPLERRTLLASQVYPPHFNVGGRSMEDWAVQQWTTIFETPVHGTDGVSIRNPVFDETGAQAAQGNFDGAFMLFGTITGGNIVRSNVAIPAGKPIFVPIAGIEFSNYDTPNADFSFPGTYSQAQLAQFAQLSALSIPSRGELHVNIDGRPVATLASHRETSPIHYTLPDHDNVLQNFGLDFTGPVDASVDGYYVMLKPLSPGEHTINFGSTIPHNDFPLLSDFSADVTYHVTVSAASNVMHEGPSNPFADAPIAPTTRIAADVLGPAGGDELMV
jgi:hypothetical protein